MENNIKITKEMLLWLTVGVLLFAAISIIYYIIVGLAPFILLIGVVGLLWSAYILPKYLSDL